MLAVLDDDFVRGVFKCPTGELCTKRLDFAFPPHIYAPELACKCERGILRPPRVVRLRFERVMERTLVEDVCIQRTLGDIFIGRCEGCGTVYWSNAKANSWR